MRNLNQQSTTIALRLFEMLQASENGEALKVNNAPGAFMQVHLEMRNEIKGLGKVFSIAHYYEQQGDLMSDPYMEFAVNGNHVIPILIEQHGGLETRQEAIIYEDDGTVKSYYPRLQNDITAFANQWMKNIKVQQGISTPTPKVKLISIDELKSVAQVTIDGVVIPLAVEEDQDGKHYVTFSKKAYHFKELN